MVTTPCPTLHREIRTYLEFVDLARDGRVPELPKGRPARGRGFVVIVNMPGYLPEEDDPATFDSYNDAWDYAVDDAREYVDYLSEFDQNAKITGDKGFGWVHVEAGGKTRHWAINSLIPCDVPPIDDEGF